MGDLLPAINVDQLTMSVNNAVSGGVLPPLPLLPPPPSAVLPPASFPVVAPGLPCVSVAGLPPLPVFTTPSGFQIAAPDSACSSPVYTSSSATNLTTMCKSALPVTMPATCNKAEGQRHREVASSASMNGGDHELNNTCNLNTNSQLPVPSLPLTLPVSMPGCPPMLIMFSLRLPMPDIAAGGNRDSALSSSSVGPAPRLPPFPPPFPLLFPIMPPQDGRHPRHLLPYPDLPPPIQTSPSPQAETLSLPPVSFPQGGLPLPPLPLQLPASLTLPPLLHQPPVPTPEGKVPSLPPLLPQPVTSHAEITLPPLVPLPAVSLPPQSSLPLPPLLPTPSTSEPHNSLPLPPFPPQSFTSFVQSGLSLTTLSPSSLHLPHLLPHPSTSMPEGSIGLPPLPSQLTVSTTDSCLSKMAPLSPSSVPLVSLTQGSFPPLPPIPAQEEAAARLPLPPQISISLPPPLPSPSVVGPHTPNSLMLSLGGQNGFSPHPSLPGQIFPPLPFIPSASAPHFLSQLPRAAASEDCPSLRNISHMDRGGKTEVHPTGALRGLTTFGGHFEETASTLTHADATASDSYDGCESPVPGSREEHTSQKTLPFDVSGKSKETSYESEIRMDELQPPSVNNGINDEQVSQSCSVALTVESGLGKFTDGEPSHACTLPETAAVRSQDMVDDRLRTVCASTFMQLASEESIPTDVHASSSQSFSHFSESRDHQQLLPAHVTASVTAEDSRDGEGSNHPMLDHLSGFVQTFGGDHSICKHHREACLSRQCMETEHCSQADLLPRTQRESYSPDLPNSYTQLAPSQVFEAGSVGGSGTALQSSGPGGEHDGLVSHFPEQTEMTQQASSQQTVSQLQRSLSSSQAGHRFDLSSLSLTGGNQSHALLDHVLPSVQQLRESTHSLVDALTDPLSSSCDMQARSLQDPRLHSHLPQATGSLLSSLSEADHAMSQLGPSFPTLTGGDVDDNDISTAVSGSMDITTAAISTSESSYAFQNSLVPDFSFPAPCSSPSPLMQQQRQPALLPSVGYSPPGLSNQGLSPNLFSSVGMGSAEQSMVDKDSHNLQLVPPSGVDGNLGLPNMSVLDMMLKTDMAVTKTSVVVPDGSVDKTTFSSLTPLFSGEYCVECNVMYKDSCQHHGTQYYFIADAPLLTRARASLPSCLYLGQSSITGHFNNTGVFAKGKVQAKTEFGPLEGRILSPAETSAVSFSTLKIFYEETSQVVDISEESLCNWLMFLKPARNGLERNLIAFQRGSGIMYVTCKDIEPGTELLFWFSSEYSKMIGAASKRATASCQYCPYCPVCSHIFFDQKQLRQHQLKEHRDVEACKWQCTICSARFQTSGRLNSHVRSQHLHQKPFSCQTCGKAFSDGSNLRTHMALHTAGQESGDYQSQSCALDPGGHLAPYAQAAVKGDGALALPLMAAGAHEVRVWAATLAAAQTSALPSVLQVAYWRSEDLFLSYYLRDVSCCREDSTFGVAAAVVARTFGQHHLHNPGVKKFTCEVCNQSFMQKAHLQAHQAIHTGVKTAQCRYCGKRFSRTSDMRQHEFQHSKEKTWNCQQCSKTFHRPTLLRRHMKVHNNEKNYLCEFCTKRFYTKFHLTRHSGSCKGLKPTLEATSSIASSVSMMMAPVSVSETSTSKISLPLISENMGELPPLSNASAMLSLSGLPSTSQQQIFDPSNRGNDSVDMASVADHVQGHLYDSTLSGVSNDCCHSGDGGGFQVARKSTEMEQYHNNIQSVHS